jgi:hypothetical protein
MGAEMETEHEFTLVLDGVAELNSAVMDTLFEAGCDDATVSSQGGHISLDFDRPAPSMRDAIISAIADVQKAGMKLARVDGPSSDPSGTESMARFVGAVNSALQLSTAIEIDPTLRPLVVKLIDNVP